MKKLLSLALVAVMLFAVIASAVPANAFTWADYVIETEAKYFDVKPFIDGYVSEEEWGEPTFGVYQGKAAVTGDRDPGLNNSFFHHLNTYDANSLSMGYELWLRWDENYFYVAVKANDPDGHSLKNGRFDTWDGDAFQMRIDPAGENGICYGDTFNAAEYAANGYRPWSSASVCDLVFGYVQNANGFCEAYDNTDGTTGKGMTEFSSNPMGVVDLAIVPAGYQYSTDSANGITTYEIAVPWAYIDGWYDDYGHEYKENATFEAKDGSAGPDGAIGREYGISTVLLNADGNSGANHYNALLTWGSGVASVQQTAPNLATCGGSNEVTLVADKVSEDPNYNANFTKYTKGGYQSPDMVPHYDTEIDQNYYVKLTYDNESDMDILGWISNGERVQLDDGNWVVLWDKATGLELPDENGVYPELNTSNYISTDGDEGEGSRFTTKGNSFTFEFDIKVTGLEEYEKYDAALYNWFGGSSSVDYQAGYYFDDGKFELIEYSSGTVVAEAAADFSLNEWHHWVFQYNNDTCTMRLYIDPPMVNGRVSPDAKPVFDDGNGTGIMWRYFDYGNIENPLMIFRRMNAQIMMDNIELYNFVDFTGRNVIGPEHKDPGTSGGNNGPVDKEHEVDVDVTVEELADGSFALSVPNTELFRGNDVTAISFTVSYDAAKLSFVGVDTIDEAAIEVSDDGNGTAVIKIKDLDAVKAVEVGATLLRVIVKPLDGVKLTAAEVKELVNFKASVTTRSYNTGDAVIAVSVTLVVVALLGTGVVLYRRKRSHVEF